VVLMTNIADGKAKRRRTHKPKMNKKPTKLSMTISNQSNIHPAQLSGREFTGPPAHNQPSMAIRPSTNGFIISSKTPLEVFPLARNPRRPSEQQPVPSLIDCSEVNHMFLQSKQTANSHLTINRYLLGSLRIEEDIKIALAVN
jgi:hypothetical protein